MKDTGLCCGPMEVAKGQELQMVFRQAVIVMMMMIMDCQAELALLAGEYQDKLAPRLNQY